MKKSWFDEVCDTKDRVFGYYWVINRLTEHSINFENDYVCICEAILAKKLFNDREGRTWEQQARSTKRWENYLNRTKVFLFGNNWCWLNLERCAWSGEYYEVCQALIAQALYDDEEGK